MFSGPGGGGVGVEVGVGVVVCGEWGARGMELVTREEARGCGLSDLEAEAEAEGGGCGLGRASWAAASSHAARAEGSMGHAAVEGSFGGG